MGKRRRRHTTSGDVAGGEGKRRRESSSSGHKKKKRKEKKHLYLVLDDWDKGYSIHKVDVHALGRRSTAALGGDPPSLRLEAPRGSHDVLFGAVGNSKILALWQPRNCPTRAAVYDTGTGAVPADGPAHPPELQPMRFVAAAAGSTRLHALHAGGLHFLDLDDTPPADPYSYATATARRWRWTQACSPLRLPFLTVDGALAPWGPIDIAAYAVHPDGRTVFVSAYGTYHRYFGTFSLDTAAASPEWTRHGEWLLPFRGQGHYDATLDAWVGFHSPGYVCACDLVPPAAGNGEWPRPEWELVKADGLFDTDPEDGVLRQSFMTLAGMGDAEFCILEPLTADGGEMTLDMDAGDEYVLRVTKFRLKRARHGHLRPYDIARSDCSLRKYDRNFAPQAFCIV
jgi:hypothetical protein